MSIISMMPMTVSFLLIPILYAGVKIAAGILVLRYGKHYAEKVREEDER